MLKSRNEELVGKYKSSTSNYEYTITNLDEQEPTRMDTNQDLVNMEVGTSMNPGVSMEEQFFEAFTQTIKG